MVKKKRGPKTKYRAEMCDEVIEYFKQGMSLTEVAVKIGVTRETVYQWIKSKPEFSEAMTIGRELSQAWWEGKGRTNLENKEFNHVCWFMNMKNRFHKDWKDKHEIGHSGPDGKPLTINPIPQFQTPEEFTEWQQSKPNQKT